MKNIFLHGLIICTCIVTISHVHAATPTVTLKANNTSNAITVPYGAAVRLTWTSKNATSCTGSQTDTGYWGGSLPINGTTTATARLFDTTTFTIVCTGSSGSAQSSVIVTVQPDPSLGPDITLTANGIADTIEIPYGGTTTIEWSSDNAIFCTNLLPSEDYKPNTIISNPTYGHKDLKQQVASSSYVIACESPTGKVATSSISITVDDEPLPDVQAGTLDGSSSVAVPYGASTTLMWTIVHAVACDGSLFDASSSLLWNIHLPPSEKQKTIAIFQPATFTVTCKNNSGAVASSSVLIDILENSDEASSTPKRAMHANKCLDIRHRLAYPSWDTRTDRDIYTLQQFLINQKILLGTPTGYFGHLTEEAVKRFQTFAQLPSTGIVSDSTRKILRNKTCKE